MYFYESMWLNPFIRALVAISLRFPTIFPLHYNISGMTVQGVSDFYLKVNSLIASQLISPILVSRAFSSIEKVGVCNPVMLAFSDAVPKR